VFNDRLPAMGTCYSKRLQRFILPCLRGLLIGGIVLLWFASQATAPAMAADGLSGAWRRTNTGWERVELLQSQPDYRRPALHPAVVGSLETLLTVTALVAFSGRRRVGRGTLIVTLPTAVIAGGQGGTSLSPSEGRGFAVSTPFAEDQERATPR
jgi:hypothetical protein